jgi:hypothetical protein
MLATAAAITVSWLGVRVGLAPALTAEAPVAIDVNRRYTEVQLGLPEVSPTPPPSRAAPARPAPSRSPSAPASARPRTKPSTTARVPTTPPAPLPASAAPTPAARAASAAPAAPQDRRPRYRLRSEGGFVTVAYSSTRVDVVDTDPIPGYTATVTRRSDRLLVVRLAGPRHASAITAYWLGAPGAQVVEEYAR